MPSCEKGKEQVALGINVSFEALHTWETSVWCLHKMCKPTMHQMGQGKPWSIQEGGG